MIGKYREDISKEQTAIDFFQQLGCEMPYRRKQSKNIKYVAIILH